MPLARTGNDCILYTLVSKKSLRLLKELSQEQGVSRALYLDTLIKKVAKIKNFIEVKKPLYYPHKPVRSKKK